MLATGNNGIGFSVGSTMTAGAGPHRQRLTVVGLANSITGTASGWVVPAEIPRLRAAGGTSETQMLYRFAHAAIGAQLHTDVAKLTAALPRGRARRIDVVLHREGRGERQHRPVRPVPARLRDPRDRDVGADRRERRRRRGRLRRTGGSGSSKSIGFTPLQVAAAYAAQVALPALVGCLAGVVVGNLLATPLLRQNASAYGVGALGVPIWVDLVVPAAICALAAVAALLPAIRAGRLSTIQAIATGRAPQSGRGYTAHRLFGRMPLPRPITIGLAAPFARPSRTFLTLAAVLLGATAVTFAVGLTSSLTRLLNGISHQQAEPVQIQMPGNGFDGGPKRAKPGTQHIKAGLPTRGRQVPAAKAEQAILAAVHSQPGTLHVVAQADESASVAGLSESDSRHRVPRPGRLDRLRPRERTLVRRPRRGPRPDRLPHPDRNVGRRNDLSQRRPQADPRPNRRRDLRHGSRY